MDITKRFDRILQIYFLLQSKSVVTSSELTDRFDTSLRTIYRDLKALELAGVPILNEPGVGYSLIEGYRIQPSRFTQEEILSLMLAEKMMQTHETRQIKRYFDAAMIKIKGSFMGQQKHDLLRLEDKLHFNNDLTANDYLPNVIDVLLNATLKQKIANIAYIKINDTDTTSRQVEPVGVFYENNFWYVIAWCHLRNDYRNFRLDRIKKVSLADDGFTRQHPPVNELRDAASYKNATAIVIKADKKKAHYIFWERQNFGFTHEQVEGEYVMMYFNCTFHPISFVRWFMTFADIAEIIEPAYLQMELTDILTSAIKRINNTSA